MKSENAEYEFEEINLIFNQTRHIFVDPFVKFSIDYYQTLNNCWFKTLCDKCPIFHSILSKFYMISVVVSNKIFSSTDQPQNKLQNGSFTIVGNSLISKLELLCILIISQTSILKGAFSDSCCKMKSER